MTDWANAKKSQQSATAGERMLSRGTLDTATVMALVDYAEGAAHLRKPLDVLNALNEVLRPNSQVRVLGASRFPVKSGDWRRVQLGKSVFFHESVPHGWVDEWIAFVKSGHPLGLMMARTCLAPFTWTELSRLLDPVGIDRWPFELAHKYGMRDGFLCPIGGRWVVGFWSPRVLDHSFTHQWRGLLFMAAAAVAVRLDQLLGQDPVRVGSRARLTPRELAVLRHASDGSTTEETANRLCLGPETIRSHLKKAEAKLGTRNRTQAVAEAMRQLLII
jgi:LuxR family quorum sensing-dependent transcriptional regulator